MESVDKTAFRLVVMTTSDSRTLQKNDSVGKNMWVAFCLLSDQITYGRREVHEMYFVSYLCNQ